MVSLHRQILFVQKDLKIRCKLHPRLVENGILEPDKAKLNIELTQAVLETLRAVADGKVTVRVDHDG